jgi:hypothetical protein
MPNIASDLLSAARRLPLQAKLCMIKNVHGSAIPDAVAPELQALQERLASLHQAAPTSEPKPESWLKRLSTYLKTSNERYRHEQALKLETEQRSVRLANNAVDDIDDIALEPLPKRADRLPIIDVEALPVDPARVKSEQHPAADIARLKEVTPERQARFQSTPTASEQTVPPLRSAPMDYAAEARSDLDLARRAQQARQRRAQSSLEFRSEPNTTSAPSSEVLEKSNLASEAPPALKEVPRYVPNSASEVKRPRDPSILEFVEPKEDVLPAATRRTFSDYWHEAVEKALDIPGTPPSKFKGKSSTHFLPKMRPSVVSQQAVEETVNSANQALGQLKSSLLKSIGEQNNRLPVGPAREAWINEQFGWLDTPMKPPTSARTTLPSQPSRVIPSADLSSPPIQVESGLLSVNVPQAPESVRQLHDLNRSTIKTPDDAKTFVSQIGLDTLLQTAGYTDPESLVRAPGHEGQPLSDKAHWLLQQAKLIPKDE